jgi:poly(3-hydroxybutyrate) depolymerase
MKKFLVFALALIMLGLAVPSKADGVSVCRTAINQEQTINWKGVPRTFHIYSPPSSVPRPTVFGFHGAGGSANSGIDLEAARLANERGWNFVSMEAYEGLWMLEKGSPDYSLVRYVKHLMNTAYCGDSSQAYAVGHSMGAMFISLVGCHTKIFQAVVPAAGVVNTQDGKCARGTAVKAIHSNDDWIVPIDGSLPESVRWITPSYMHSQASRIDTVKSWGYQNGCKSFVTKYPRRKKIVYSGRGCGSPTSFVEYSYGVHLPPNVASTAIRFFGRVA